MAGIGKRMGQLPDVRRPRMPGAQRPFTSQRIASASAQVTGVNLDRRELLRVTVRVNAGATSGYVRTRDRRQIGVRSQRFPTGSTC
jgi:hypothetical protein